MTEQLLSKCPECGKRSLVQGTVKEYRIEWLLWVCNDCGWSGAKW